jgi:hypothetical protein
LDTGTNQSFILKAIVKEVGVQPSGISLRVRLPNGEETYCSHSVTPLIKVDGHQLPQKLTVIELEEYDGILGNDCLLPFSKENNYTFTKAIHKGVNR